MRHGALSLPLRSGHADLHGVARANIDGPAVYVPDSLPLLSALELPRVEAVLATEVNEMDQLMDHLVVAQKFLDVDTLVHIQNTTLQLEARRTGT
jgi:hypothetical protein